SGEVRRSPPRRDRHTTRPSPSGPDARKPLATQIEPQDVPALPQRRVRHELRPARGIAGEAVEQDQKATRAGRTPQAVGQTRTVANGQRPEKFHRKVAGIAIASE